MAAEKTLAEADTDSAARDAPRADVATPDVEAAVAELEAGREFSPTAPGTAPALTEVPEPGGQSPTIATAAFLAAPDRFMGTPTAARTMRGLQATVGNARAGQILAARPFAAPAEEAPAAGVGTEPGAPEVAERPPMAAARAATRVVRPAPSPAPAPQAPATQERAPEAAPPPAGPAAPARPQAPAPPPPTPAAAPEPPELAPVAPEEEAKAAEGAEPAAPGPGPPGAPPAGLPAPPHPGPEGGAAALLGPAAPAPEPTLDASSSEALVGSLGNVAPSAFGPAVAQASEALPGLQAKEKQQLAASYPEVDKPTGMAPVAANPKAPPTDLPPGPLPEVPGPGGREGAPPEAQQEVATGPVPGSEVATDAQEPVEEDSGGSWWSSIFDRIQRFFKELPTTDSGVSTDAGPRPNVDLSGDAAPSRNKQEQATSDQTVVARRAEADSATEADFGEGGIRPTVAPERLRPGYRPEPPPATVPRGAAAPSVDPEVRSAFDQQAAAQVGEKVAEQRAREAEDRKAYRDRSAEVRAEGKRQLEEEDRRTRAEQMGLRAQARADVKGEREHWREENSTAQSAYSTQSEAKRLETDDCISKKVTKAEDDADKRLTKAEGDAAAEKRKKEEEAAAAKREAESKPRSWWDRVKGAVSAVFSALKRAVTALFNALRAAVKRIINIAKAAVKGIIEAARMAIVGLVKAFGTVLKGLVTLALLAFPETAAKARAWIDDKVDGAVDAVNAAADKLKKAADRVLDWVAQGLDYALGLLQKAVLFYIGIFEALARLLMMVLEKIGNLVSAAKRMPDHFLGQVSEEVLGMDLSAPLPIERSKPPTAAQGAEAAHAAGELPQEDMGLLKKRTLGDGDVAVDNVLPLELDPELLLSLPVQEGGEREFGENADPQRSGEAAMAEAAGGLAAGPGGPESAGPSSAGVAAGEAGSAWSAEQDLLDLMNQPSPDACEPSTSQEPAGSDQVPEHLKKGPFSAWQRGRYLMDKMWKGIKQWFRCNWPKLLLAAVGALLGVILLNVLTGGAIMAALPLLMQLFTAFMLAQTVVRVTSYVGEYLSKGWDGDTDGAGKSLARGLAIAGIELIFALAFNLGTVIKTLKQGAKATVKAVAQAIKTTIKTTITAAKSLGRVLLTGLKTAVKNGRLILQGLRSGFARGAKSLVELAERLWKAVRFRKFKIVIRGGWFRLLGWINPWVVIMSGPLQGEMVEVKRPVGQRLRLGAEDVFETVAGGKVKGVVVGLAKKAPSEYRKILALAQGQKIKALTKYVIHHVVERQVIRRFKLSRLVDGVFMHAPANLRAIPKGFINEVVHLSKIRVMWDDLYRQLRTLATAEARLAAIEHFAVYSERFIDDMLKVAAKQGTNKAKLLLEAEKWLATSGNDVAAAVKAAIAAGKKQL